MDATGLITTAAGMFGLRSPASFNHVVDYDTWEAALLEDPDILHHINTGALVPVNIGGDGTFQVAARTGMNRDPAVLTPRERQYLLASSDPYLFVTPQDAVISGIEDIQAEPNTGLRVPLPAGRWTVTIALIEWTAEPGQQDHTGQPAATALPDFTLLINPAHDATRHRTSIHTFDR